MATKTNQTVVVAAVVAMAVEGDIQGNVNVTLARKAALQTECHRLVEVRGSTLHDS